MSTKILVTSEIATGVVNGINKTFTVVKSIYNINSIVINNIAYAQYSLVGNTILMDDAPVSGTVLVSYSYENNYDYLDNSGWIVGEILSGAINGTNKVYSSFYPISMIDEVRVNGIVVIGYSIIGNSILLAVAPSIGYVELDYFRKDLVIIDYNRDNYYTKKEVRDMVYSDIGQDDTSVQYPIVLVNNAIIDGVTELITHISDKSRFASYSIDSINSVQLTPIANSISTFTLTTTKFIPPRGRLMSLDNGGKVDYSAITSTNIMSVTSIDGIVNTATLFFVGYQLPRNIKRIVSINYQGHDIQDSGNINNFLYGNSFYFINNGYIYLKNNAIYTIEVELNEYINSSDDSSLIYVDKEDIGVIVYYALKQVYQSRESDKLGSASQLFIDKLRSYKMRMIKKRSSGKGNIMRTNNRLIPSNARVPNFPTTQLIPQIIIKPSDNIDGGFAAN